MCGKSRADLEASLLKAERLIIKGEFDTHDGVVQG